jgi:multicomponent Na+:H+ antiporter subunit D
MAAPAPVSALLHAVAVVKAGAFGVIRVIYDVFGAARWPSSASASRSPRLPR